MSDMNEKLARMLAERASSSESLFGDPVLNEAMGWKKPLGQRTAHRLRPAVTPEERMERLLEAIVWADESLAPPKGSIPWSQVQNPDVPWPKNERGMPPSALNPYKLKPGDLEFLERYKPPPPRR